MLLELDDVHVSYGKIEAIRGISFEVDEGEIVTLIGANGAGKSTTLKTISGLRTVAQGEIRFNGQVITRMPGHKRVLAGISQAPEGRGIFPGMTVVENLHMGAYARSSDFSKDLAKVYDLFPRLAERKRQAGGTLSGGEQQMLAIGRALMSEPKVLLLDEPSMGLAPVLVDAIFDTIRRLHAEGTTILLIEQNARMALQVADRGYVIESGGILLTDTAENLQENEEVQNSYLGIA
jgi:branched-chain amino acid transport system ATP-binding protein